MESAGRYRASEMCIDRASCAAATTPARCDAVQKPERHDYYSGTSRAPEISRCDAGTIGTVFGSKKRKEEKRKGQRAAPAAGCAARGITTKLELTVPPGPRDGDGSPFEAERSMSPYHHRHASITARVNWSPSPVLAPVSDSVSAHPS